MASGAAILAPSQPLGLVETAVLYLQQPKSCLQVHSYSATGTGPASMIWTSSWNQSRRARERAFASESDLLLSCALVLLLQTEEEGKSNSEVEMFQLTTTGNQFLHKPNREKHPQGLRSFLQVSWSDLRVEPFHHYFLLRPRLYPTITFRRLNEPSHKHFQVFYS